LLRGRCTSIALQCGEEASHGLLSRATKSLASVDSAGLLRTTKIAVPFRLFRPARSLLPGRPSLSSRMRRFSGRTRSMYVVAWTCMCVRLYVWRRTTRTKCMHACQACVRACVRACVQRPIRQCLSNVGICCAGDRERGGRGRGRWIWFWVHVCTEISMSSFWARSSICAVVYGGEAEIEWRHLVECKDAGAIPSAIDGH
jgi:hypothetical protein